VLLFLRHGVLVNCYTFSVSITVSDIFILQLLVSVTVNWRNTTLAYIQWRMWRSGWHDLNTTSK